MKEKERRRIKKERRKEREKKKSEGKKGKERPCIRGSRKKVPIWGFN